MDGLRDFDTKQSKSDRERQISYDITYMQNLSTYIYIYIYIYTPTHTHTQMTSSTKQKHTHRLTEQTHGSWGERR